MQRGRFAQEFLAELMREPRAFRTALLSERARWLRGLKVGGREELLFELEMHLRALELAFLRRHASIDGRQVLGQDFAEETRAARDTLHRATMVARRLIASGVEHVYQLRAYVERQVAEERRRGRLAAELIEQRTPEESLLLLRQNLRALQGIADQLLRHPFVTFQSWGDFATLGEQVVLGSKYFRPPGALEFRTEYDRVGSVRLLELVRKVDEARARKALALGFLANFRLLRYLRHVPPSPVAAPRRALLTALLIRDEAQAVASYLGTDLPRLAAGAVEAPAIQQAAAQAVEHLRRAINASQAGLSQRPVPRQALEDARNAFVESAKAAAGALAHAVEPSSSASELFDGQRARRDRAERLRRDLWIQGQLIRHCLDGLFPAVKGEPARAYDALAALSRFTREFRQLGYHLLRSGDHEPFDRFFTAFEALANAAESPARDRHLYLECRRFLSLVERSLALVNRRAELLDVPIDVASFEAELRGYQSATTSAPPEFDKALADQLLSPPTEDDDEALLEQTPPPGTPQSPLFSEGLPEDDVEQAQAHDDAPFSPEHGGDQAIAEPPSFDEPLLPGMRRIWRR